MRTPYLYLHPRLKLGVVINHDQEIHRQKQVNEDQWNHGCHSKLERLGKHEVTKRDENERDETCEQTAEICVELRA